MMRAPQGAKNQRAKQLFLKTVFSDGSITMGMPGDSRFRNLFGHYEAYEETLGDFTYLDVKRIPMGLFGNLLVRIVQEYDKAGLKYVDHFDLSQEDKTFRVTFLFEKKK